ncbi:MAG: hypothetical protein ACTSUC_19550 [Promethearchaeota archaeon]
MTDETLINIIPFEGKPFSKEITVWQYFTSDKFNWADIGWKIRIMRQLLRTREDKIIIFQEGNIITANTNLFLVEEIKHLLKNFIEYTEIRNLNVKSTKDLATLQRLLGEAFSDKLRKNKRNAYKVVERSNAVYYATPSIKIADFHEIEIWPGFQYTPLIQNDGAAGMIIDPRSQYHTKQTLRDIYDSNFDLSKELDLYKYHIDVCPIDCPEKRDPLSTCIHSGSGQPITISDFIQKPPSEILIDVDGKRVNLIEFHNKERNCPKKMLGNYIQDKPPVAVTNFGYHYPLERIRRSPYSHLIKDNDDRKKLNRLVTLNPITRYNKTVKMYAPLLDNLRINDQLELRSTGRLISQKRESSFSISSGQLSPRKLLLATKESFYPIRDLIEDGPYRKPYHDKEINVLILNIGEDRDSDKFNAIFSSIIKGKSESLTELSIEEKFLEKVSFPTFLGIKVNVFETLMLKNLKEFEDIKARILNIKDEKLTNLLVVLCIGKNSEGLIIPVKKFLIGQNIPNQGLSKTTFLEKLNDQQISYFQNIILGCFCKISGVPWAINNIESSTIYIGYNGKFQDKDSIAFSMAAFDSKGIWLKGTFSNVKRDNFSLKFKADLEYLLSNREENEIRFYVNGTLKEISEFPIIKKNLDEITKNYIIIEIMNNPLRIYNVSRNGWYSANRGSYVQILPNQICLVTTFTGRYGTPNPILIRLKKGNKKDFIKYLTEIFLLTHSYPGYIRLNTRYPSPVHAAKAIFSNSNNLSISDFTFEIPWFI